MPGTPAGMAAGLAAGLPVVVIGGYLGAGKTTLVNHLLRHAAGRRIAVLVNDFGDVNIDADLIEGAEAGVLSLAGGCLCCSFGDDLVGTLTGLRRRDPAPDLVLIELSGVALPAAVARSARLASGIDVVGTLVVTDAADIRRQAGDRYVGDTVRQQLRDADWLLLNKGDLTDAPTLQALLPWLAGLAPSARVMTCAAQAVPAELVLGWPDRPADPQRRVGRAAGEAGDAGDAVARFDARPIGASARDRLPAASLFISQSLPLPPGTDLDALGAALAAPGSGVLRAKALVAAADNATGALLQVAGGRWQVTPAVVRGEGRLVLIALRDRLNIDLQPWTAPR
jgi:G3E family GTPase